MVNLILVFLSVTLVLSFTPSIPEISYKFKWINFTFDDPVESANYFNQGNYTKCMPAGIKLNSTSSIFISIPRWQGCSPATFNRLVGVSDGVALFEPFPSFAGNEVGNPSALQSVLGFEIDLEDNLWVLDQGKFNGSASIPGSQKLNKYSSGGSLLDSFDLTNYTSPESSFLNDLVLDVKAGFVYISDSGIPINSSYYPYPGLIVINLNTRSIYRMLSNDSSVQYDPSVWVTINSIRVQPSSPMETGADGIALSCDKSTLYYTPLTSRELYAIPTKYLQESIGNAQDFVVNLGYKYSASDGIMCSQNGRMYLTAIELNSILLQSDITPNAENFQFNILKPIIQNQTYLQWPDTIGFDNANKKIYVVANQLQNFTKSEVNFTNPVNGDANFYIWSLYVNDRSYLEDCIYSESNDSSDGFPAWAIVLVIIVVLVVVIIAVCAVRKYYQAKKKRQTFL